MAPRGSGVSKLCHSNAVNRSGRPPTTGSSRPSEVSVTSCQPTSGASIRRAGVPAASPSSSAPRHTPSTGMPASSSPASQRFSARSHGCSSSWSGCIPPPSTIAASKPSSGAEESAGTHVTSSWPRSEIGCANTPGPASAWWTTVRTRIYCGVT